MHQKKQVYQTVRKQQKAISNRPKSDKEEIIVAQKTRILNLENEVKQLKN